MRLRRLLLIVAPVGSGIVFQAGCDPVPAFLNLANGFNPCLTILACDPAYYAFATSGLEGAGADPEKSPFCTFPPYCGPDVDPYYGGILGGP
jgi:hypothetical protein